jgi:CSLREA domain-containing protein
MTHLLVQTDLTRHAPLQDDPRQVRALRFAVAALAAVLLAFAAPAAAPAQTFPGVFNVDTTKDGNDGECNKDCTLREAVSLATAQGNSISLPPGVYKLTLGELVLRNNTTIVGAGLVGGRGAGARTTIIDARGASRVVQVPANTFAIVAGVTLTGGRADTGAGALVGNNGSLGLYNATIDGNVATGRGGGVDVNRGSFTALWSTISNNRAANGGGIALEPEADVGIDSSTISGNTASGSGGGITSLGTFTLLNATIANNRAAAGGGVFVEAGTAGGDGIFNTIISAASGGACGGAMSTEGRIGWSGNIAADATCGFTGTQGRSSLDPRLGALKNNKGPTDTMALLAGSPAINAGDPNRCFGTDQRGAQAVGTCDIGAFEFGGQPPEPVLPPPVAGETVNVGRTRGTVKIKLPGSDDFFTLEQRQQVPVGSTFDTSKGRVNLQAAGSQKAWFYQGQFKLGQKHGRKPLSTLSLSGKLSCGGAGKATAAAKKKKKRRLWGDGKGKFRTKGSFSSATVRGTKWMVQDTCQGTLTVVKRGKVAVKDFVRHRTVIVKAGHRYFARRKK